MRLINQRYSDDVVVYHYPVRSYEQFERNVKNRQPLLHKGAKMGNHYQRWVRMLDQGKLEEEFSRFVMTDKDADVLVRFGITDRNSDARDVIQAASRTMAGHSG
jgi:hypothetical protein